jgi:hypothetical protein
LNGAAALRTRMITSGGCSETGRTVTDAAQRVAVSLRGCAVRLASCPDCPDVVADSAGRGDHLDASWPIAFSPAAERFT